MKKTVLLCLGILLFMLGCVQEDVMTLPRTDRGRIVQVTGDDIETAFTHDETMILYIGSPLCQSCQTFKTHLETWVDAHDVLVHAIEDNDAFPPDNDLAPYDVVPTLVFIRDGMIVASMDYDSHPEEFKDYDAFESHMDRHFS